MKKVFFSGLMVVALSTMAFAQQSRPANRPVQPQVSKSVTPQPAQPRAKADTTTRKKSTVMTKPRHRKTHKSKKHTSRK